MIELNKDGSDFEEKITYFLNNSDAYKALVDRNYLYVSDYHRWRNRLYSILETVGISTKDRIF